MHTVSVSFFQLLADCFQEPYYVAHIPVFVFHSHVDDAAIIRNAVKFSMDFYSTFPEFLPDIPGKNDIGSAIIRDFMNNSVILIWSMFHNNTSSRVLYAFRYM